MLAGAGARLGEQEPPVGATKPPVFKIASRQGSPKPTHGSSPQRGEHSLQGAQAQPAKQQPLKPPRLPLDSRRHLPRQEIREGLVAGVIDMPPRRAHIRQIDTGHRGQSTRRLCFAQDGRSLHVLREQLAVENEQAILRLASGGTVNPCLARGGEVDAGDFVFGDHLWEIVNPAIGRGV